MEIKQFKKHADKETLRIHGQVVLTLTQWTGAHQGTRASGSEEIVENVGVCGFE